MKNIKINNKILLFSCFIIFYAIFNLYFKQNAGNDTSISEWLINYNGGFTRRGLGGEINIFISNIFDISLRSAIFYLQSLLHIIFIVFLYFYLKNFYLNIFQIFALFSPLFLIYPISEIESLGRKEILLLISFIISIHLTNKKFSAKLFNYQILISFPILCLIWEQVVLFAPFYVVLIVYKNNLKTFKSSLKYSFFIFTPSIVTFLLIFNNPLSMEGHKMMCEFLQNEFNERCYMSAVLLVQNTIYFDTLHIHTSAKFFPDYFRYLLVFIIGFGFLHLSLITNHFTGKENFISAHFKPIYLFFLLYLPVVPLFVFGLDWGRWINIMYSLSIMLYFYLLKNSHITNFYVIRSGLLKKILEKKILLFFIFYLFAFFWNPKTVITGDIATNSLYKIVYNSSKKIFNFDGIQLFQDNPIIKFHKKYIE